jgi:hypothetical protein
LAGRTYQAVVGHSQRIMGGEKWGNAQADQYRATSWDHSLWQNHQMLLSTS